jgi:hypothetical protein
MAPAPDAVTHPTSAVTCPMSGPVLIAARGRIRAGVVGTGHMGQYHVLVYAELPDVELVGVVDIDADRGKTVAAGAIAHTRLGIQTFFLSRARTSETTCNASLQPINLIAVRPSNSGRCRPPRWLIPHGRR